MSANALSRSTQTRPSLLRLAAIVWVILVALALVVWCTGTAASYRFLVTPCSSALTCNLNGALRKADFRTLGALGVSPQAYAIYTLVLINIVVLVWLGVALLIFFQRRQQLAALAISLILATGNLISVNGPLTALVYTYPALGPLNWIANVVGNAAYILLFFLFPDGKVVPRWVRWVVVTSVIQSIITASLPPESPVNTGEGVWGAITGLLFLGTIGVAIYSQVYRYRHAASQTQRQQTKWAAYGLVVTGIGILMLNLAMLVATSAGHPLSELITNTLFPLVMLAIPVTIGIAILRHRLYDIDVIINRTLVYGSLTAILAAVYFGLVIGTQGLLRVVLGTQSAESPLVIVASTLVIAALFHPLRRRLQRAIDRRFYRQKYDAAKTLETFAATLRGEVDLIDLQRHLVAVVEKTMQPARVSLWLRREEGVR